MPSIKPPKQEYPGWVETNLSHERSIRAYPSPRLMAYLLNMPIEQYIIKIREDRFFKKAILLYANMPNSEPAKFEKGVLETAGMVTMASKKEYAEALAKIKLVNDRAKNRKAEAESLEKHGFVIYALGLCTMSVCTTLDRKELVKKVNIFEPTGIRHPWKISRDKKFRTGQPHPCECENHKGARHFLLEC